MRSNPWLKKLYRQYNRKYFGNKLPLDIFVVFGNARTWRSARISKNSAAVTFIKGGKPLGIVIRYYKHKGRPYIKCDLLHEMIHVAHPRASHGPIFKQEVRRLAALGALDKLL